MKNMKTYILLCLLFTINSWAQNCNYNVSSNNFVGTLGDTQQSQGHSFTISRGSNSANCQNFRAFFSTGNANNYNRKVYNGSKTINYNMYKESALNNVLKDFGDANASEYIQGNLSNNNQNYPFNFFIKLIDKDSVFTQGPGYYNDLIQINFYNIKNNGTLVYQKSAYFNIQIIIPRYAELSLGPSGFSHDPAQTTHIMNFGTLASNEVQNATLNVKGNVGFGVYMSSQNGTVLKNGSATIPYQININNGGYRNLGGAGQSVWILNNGSATPITGNSYPLAVRIGTVPSNPPTGDYTDTITVTINAW